MLCGDQLTTSERRAYDALGDPLLVALELVAAQSERLDVPRLPLLLQLGDLAELAVLS